ncbi:MAG: hypothetical protein AB7L09_01665 [Nitrospira sp.]
MTSSDNDEPVEEIVEELQERILAWSLKHGIPNNELFPTDVLTVVLNDYMLVYRPNRAYESSDNSYVMAQHKDDGFVCFNSLPGRCDLMSRSRWDHLLKTLRQAMILDDLAAT